MRQHLSVFMLMVHHSFARVAALIAVLAAAQAGLFWLALRQGGALVYIVQDSGIGWVLAACFLLVTALLSWSCHEVSGSYTAGRLSVSGRWVFLWQCVYNTLCYLLLWAVEILLVIGLCRLYEAQAAPEEFTNQTVFLTFYRSGLLHALLPLDDAILWARNIIVVAALGISPARHPGPRQRKEFLRLFEPFWLIYHFVSDIGSWSNSFLTVSVFVLDAGLSLYNALAFGKERWDET